MFIFCLAFYLRMFGCRSSMLAAVGAGQLRESEGVLSEGAEPPEGPLQGHVPSRHRLLSPG